MRPTRTRYWLIAFAITLAIVQYIDRVCISQAMPDIARDLRLDDKQKGAIFAAFGLAYALFEIPTGWMGDKWGARKVLVRHFPSHALTAPFLRISVGTDAEMRVLSETLDAWLKAPAPRA